MELDEIETFLQPINADLSCRKCGNRVPLKGLEDHRTFHEALEIFGYDFESKPTSEMTLARRRRSLIKDFSNSVDTSQRSYRKRLGKIDVAYEVIRSGIHGRLPEWGSRFIEHRDVIVKSGSKLEDGIAHVGVSASTNEKWRSSMEDAFCCNSGEEVAFFALFDGYGGEIAARQCASHFYAIFKEAICSGDRLQVECMEGEPCNLIGSFESAFDKMDKVLLHGVKETSRNRWSGCSATTCVVRPNVLHVANVGNAKAVLIDADENIRVLTEEHTPKSRKEKNRIKASGDIHKWSKTAWVNGVAMTTRGLGNHGDPMLKSSIICKPAISCVNLSLGCVVLLASSGFWEVFDEDEALLLIKHWLRFHLEPSNPKQTGEEGSNNSIEIVVEDSCASEMGDWEGNVAIEIPLSKKFGDIIQTFQDASIVAKDLSKFLLKAALTVGTKDNITVMTILPIWEVVNT